MVNDSINILDAFIALRNLHISPLELIRRADQLRLERLARVGAYASRYTRNDRHITAAELTFLRANPGGPPP